LRNTSSISDPIVIQNAQSFQAFRWMRTTGTIELSPLVDTAYRISLSPHVGGKTDKTRTGFCTEEQRASTSVHQIVHQNPFTCPTRVHPCMWHLVRDSDSVPKSILVHAAEASVRFSRTQPRFSEMYNARRFAVSDCAASRPSADDNTLLGTYSISRE
jgi:hypothetical protein